MLSTDKIWRTATVLVLPVGLAGCLNAASGDVKPEGSVPALHRAQQEEPLVRTMIAKSMAATAVIKGGLLVGRYRTKDAILAGPHIHQDPISRQWGIFYCVKASMNATFHPEFKALAMVTKTTTGWTVETMDGRYGVGCAVNPRAFPELDAVTNKLADEDAAARR